MCLDLLAGSMAGTAVEFEGKVKIENLREKLELRLKGKLASTRLGPALKDQRSGALYSGANCHTVVVVHCTGVPTATQWHALTQRDLRQPQWQAY